MYTIQQIATILHITNHTLYHQSITQLCVDSRRISQADETIFFCITTTHNNGHAYINDAYHKGVRSFVVSTMPCDVSVYPQANFLQVPNVVQALQLIATHHRSQYTYPVIGVTGSNGKTIVKEWLNQLLQHEYNIIRSPKSYNSQLGVPLSIWHMRKQHTLAIIEAGISTYNEMEHLSNIIQPTIGILTNIGTAHSAGFSSMEQKLTQKLLLFTKVDLLICSSSNTLIHHTLKAMHIPLFSWGSRATDTLCITLLTKENDNTHIQYTYNHAALALTLPFTNDAAIENAMHCVCVLHYFNNNIHAIQQKIYLLQPVAMRLEVIKGANNCIIINDSYSNDINALQIGLHYLQQQTNNLHRTVILTTIEDSSTPATELYTQVAALLTQHKVTKLIAIGSTMELHKASFAHIPTTIYYSSVANAVAAYHNALYHNEVILVKGARSFAIEQYVTLLQEQVHQTVLEVNLTALAHNIQLYQQCLQPSTAVMAIVKAFGYGSGAVEVATVLQQRNVKYLAVAYPDEGVILRKAGIHLPIMVMNTDEAAFNAMVAYNLEPELYSLSILTAFVQYATQHALVQYPVHIKFDTGMHRLGFVAADMQALCAVLLHQNVVQVSTAFTHLVASEDATHDAYTIQQNEQYTAMVNELEATLQYHVTKHIANTAAIIRWPQLQHNMVRLGIGMYGVSTSTLPTRQVLTLKTTIAQLKTIQQHNTVGYGRKGKVIRPSIIATVRIGYADGYNRQLGNGVGYMVVNGVPAPTIGNICMDMTMLDVTDVPNVQEHDMVEVYGNAIPIQQVASWCHTIPYEILTGIAQRVKRVYIEE